MRSEQITIRRMTAADIAEVLVIDASAFPTPWPRENYESELRNPAARYLVAEIDGAVAGFAGAWLAWDEGQVTRIAVGSEYRRQGVGSHLMQALLQYMANLGAVCATLEVRKSNEGALAMYKRLGFLRLRTLKGHYENGEDAISMVRISMPPPDPDFTEAETIRE